MRKWFVILVFFLLSLSLYSISKASDQGVLLADFPNGSYLNHTLKQESSYDIFKDLFLLPEKSFDEKESAKMIKRIGSLPRPLLIKLKNQGIAIKLFNGRLTDNPTAYHLRGKKPRGYESKATWDDVPGIGGSKTVLVKIGYSEKGRGHGSVNLELHELAHSIDRYIYMDLKNNQTFLKVWKSERTSLFPGRTYFLIFPEEYFAETFAMFYLNEESRKQLKELAPKTYDFLENLQ